MHTDVESKSYSEREQKRRMDKEKEREEERERDERESDVYIQDGELRLLIDGCRRYIRHRDDTGGSSFDF